MYVHTEISEWPYRPHFSIVRVTSYNFCHSHHIRKSLRKKPPDQFRQPYNFFITYFLRKWNFAERKMKTGQIRLKYDVNIIFLYPRVVWLVLNVHEMVEWESNWDILGKNLVISLSRRPSKIFVNGFLHLKLEIASYNFLFLLFLRVCNF